MYIHISEAYNQQTIVTHRKKKSTKQFQYEKKIYCVLDDFLESTSKTPYFNSFKNHIYYLSNIRKYLVDIILFIIYIFFYYKVQLFSIINIGLPICFFSFSHIKR